MLRTDRRGDIVSFYRSVDHRTLSVVCGEIQKKPLPPKYGSYVPPGGFGPDIVFVAGAARELQQKRHKADYDPEARFKRWDALLAIETAREAMMLFGRAPEAERKAFLTLLVCPPR